jgi:DNA-binding transcriptional ArsR family regulator
MTTVWRSSIGPATKRLVLLALADSANDEGSCFLLISTLARKSGAGESSVQRVLKELEDEGLLKREFRRNRSTIFYLDVDAIEGSQIETPAVGGVSNRDLQGSQIEVKGSQIETHNRVLEPKEEPKDHDAVASKPKKTRTVVDYSDDFEAAWKAYGLKGAKRTAWAEWARAIQRTTVETILAAIPPYLAAHPDAKFRKDFERWLKGDVWESAECRTAGFDGAPAMTADEAEAWLLDRYHAAAAEEVAARTGRKYEAPHPKSAPPGMDPAEFQLADRKQWIKYYRRGLVCVLMGHPFRNGTEVEGV